MNKKSIDVFNTLIKINNDRIEGYETASSETRDENLQGLFKQLSKTSEQCKRELVFEISSLGGTPTEGTNYSGKFFRVWMDVKTAILGKDLQAILNLCEYGEDAAIETYQDILENKSSDLTVGQLVLLKKQYLLLKADHDKVRSLRDNLVEPK